MPIASKATNKGIKVMIKFVNIAFKEWHILQQIRTIDNPLLDCYDWRLNDSGDYTWHRTGAYRVPSHQQYRPSYPRTLVIWMAGPRACLRRRSPLRDAHRCHRLLLAGFLQDVLRDGVPQRKCRQCTQCGPENRLVHYYRYSACRSGRPVV